MWRVEWVIIRLFFFSSSNRRLNQTVFTVTRKDWHFCITWVKFRCRLSCTCFTAPWPFLTSVFQSGVSSRPARGVHPHLYPGVKEGCPERHHLPLPDIWSAGIPTGAAHASASSRLPLFPPVTIPSRSHSLLPFTLSLLLCIAPFVYSFCPSLISLLHSHPLSPSIYFLSWHLFNSLSLSFLRAFCPLLFFHLSRSLSPRRSSLDHLPLSSFIHLHCYSCVFHDEALESLRVPIITNSLRPDLNTQCVWWMEAKSPH